MKVIHDASKSEKVIPAEFPKFQKNEKQMSFARKHDKEMKKEISRTEVREIENDEKMHQARRFARARAARTSLVRPMRLVLKCQKGRSGT